jgi:hypothetical protein
MPDLKTIYESAEVPADLKHALGLQAIWDAAFLAGASQAPAMPPTMPEEREAIVIKDDAGNVVTP